MIKKLSVKNFKSIKELEIDCRKINLFIGEPNSGKSNILEALGILSWCAYRERGEKLKEYVRFESIANLLHDNSVDEVVEIAVIRDLRRIGGLEPLDAELAKAGGVVPEEMQILSGNEVFDFNVSLGDSRVGGIQLDGGGEYHGGSGKPDRAFRAIKFYRFRGPERIQEGGKTKEMSFLMPPYGTNIYRVVSTSKRLRSTVSTFFRDFDLKLMLRTETETFEFLKEIEDVIFNFPYLLLSDTLQRMLFFTVAMESNENSTLVFEEPESHAYPDYTYNLGKQIALDKTNQYFIATHNPYLFLAILEKTPKDDVNVVITYSEDYQTKVKCLNDEEKSKIMVYDPFANLDYFLGTLDSFVEEDEQ